MLKKSALLLIVLVAGVLLYATTRPSTIHVERSVTVRATPDKIFPLINDFHSWGSWSPYERKDLSMKKVYSGASQGKGAVYEWQGNSDVGEGRMEITEAAAPSRIAIDLHFLKPFEGHNVAVFTVVPQGDGTTVTWTMDGPMAYVAKLMGVFMNMDTMIGSDFEAGLVSLKGLAEKQTVP